MPHPPSTASPSPQRPGREPASLAAASRECAWGVETGNAPWEHSPRIQAQALRLAPFAHGVSHAGPAVLQQVKWSQVTAKFRTDLKQGGKRVRHKGDALYGARLRFVRKAQLRGLKLKGTETTAQVIALAAAVLGISFKDWKQGREAQHLVPAAEAMKRGLPDSFINSEVNLMMLREGNRPKGKGLHPNYLKSKVGKKTHKLSEAMHIKLGIAHPYYNQLAGRMLNKYDRFTAAGRLRRAHKVQGAGGYADTLGQYKTV